jgi:predicted AAA+ superfamily ATPase
MLLPYGGDATFWIENAVGLHSRRSGEAPRHAGARDTWECDFVTEDEAIQVTPDLTPMNRPREVRGLIEAASMAGVRRATILTLDQTDRLRGEGTTIEVLPAWRLAKLADHQGSIRSFCGKPHDRRLQTVDGSGSPAFHP